ncbi:MULTISPECIES: PadR family transcriptional regulator [Haloferax]|nr:PadR family transcriptional regulator [Haloferax sp. S2CR25]MDS0445610.1 PadR family transcriptional regulator [Haloferax sp. S2CR25-2]
MSDSSGQTIKTELEETQGRDLLTGRVYTNLNELVDKDLVNKGSKNGRTNEYSLTDKGRDAVEKRRRWEQRFLKQTA